GTSSPTSSTATGTKAPRRRPLTLTPSQMRRYLLDTTPLTAYLTGRPAAVAQYDPWLDRDEAATSVLVYAEVVEGLRSRPDFATLHQAFENCSMPCIPSP